MLLFRTEEHRAVTRYDCYFHSHRISRMSPHDIKSQHRREKIGILFMRVGLLLLYAIYVLDEKQLHLSHLLLELVDE